MAGVQLQRRCPEGVRAGAEEAEGSGCGEGAGEGVAEGIGAVALSASTVAQVRWEACKLRATATE